MFRGHSSFAGNEAVGTLSRQAVNDNNFSNFFVPYPVSSFTQILKQQYRHSGNSSRTIQT